MKILLVGPVPPSPAGGAISRGQLATAFAAAGHPTTVVAPITDQLLRRGDDFAARHPEVTVVRYTVPFFDEQPDRAPKSDYERAERTALQVLVPDLIRRARPDLIVAGREAVARHLPEIIDGAGIPSVLLVRGNPTGSILRGDYPDSAAQSLLNQFRRFDLIIAVAEYLAGGLRRLGCPRVIAIPNAIDADAFGRPPDTTPLRRELSIPPQSPVVLAPSNLNPRKRPWDVLRSATLVLARRPDAVFVMAGAGPQSVEVRLGCRDLGIEPFFRFPGWIDYPRMPALMALASTVVMTSEVEGMARVYLEAMAAGRLLIASDIPPAREIVRDGDNGLLFRLGDPTHLAERILQALDDPNLRQRAGRKAQDALANRRLQQVVPQYLDAFRRVIA